MILQKAQRTAHKARSGVALVGALLAAYALLFAPDAKAQSISGKVIDPQGKPVTGLEVFMHGVNNETGKGAEVDKDTTKTDGSFEMSVSSPDSKLTYFVAVVWKGQLFVGDMLQPPFPANKEYVVQVGVEPVDLSPEGAAAPVSAEEEKKDKTAGIIIVLAALVVLGSAATILWQRRPDPRRKMLVSLARLENELEADPNNDTLQQRRTELRERLRSAKSA